MQLDEVKPVHAEVDPRPVGPGTEARQREVLRYLRYPPAHLGGDHDALTDVIGKEPSDDPLAAPVAVHVRGVKERDSGLDGRAQHRERVRFGHGAPVCAKLPGAEADDRDSRTGLPEKSLLHDPRSYAVRLVARQQA